MRIVSWNINHRTRARSVSREVPEGLASLDPDVIVLTEYVPGSDHEGLCGHLGALGFPNIHISALSPGHNQVLIATRSPSQRGRLRLGEPTPNADCNFLHVHLELEQLDLVGFRVPAYSDGKRKAEYWRRFTKRVRPLVNHRIVLAGDFNTHIGRKGCPGAQELRGFRDAGWQLITPGGNGSYCGPKGKISPIDHALVGQKLTVNNAEYIAEKGIFRFGGTPAAAMSDHAVLAVEVAFDPVPAPRAPQN